MFCKKCGCVINLNTKFCSECGTPVPEADAYIIFKRESQFYGCAVPISIFLDGVCVGKMSSNTELKVPVMTGIHKLEFNLWSGDNQYDIQVTKEQPHVLVKYRLKAGLVTSSPTIMSIESI